MTFENFKRDFEKFSKIDTSDKLALCEDKYRKHLLNLEDDNYFYPLENSTEENIISKYDQGLRNIFNVDKIQENQFLYLVAPSFEPEYLLTIDYRQYDYLITYSKLKINYWTTLYDNKRKTEIEKLVSTCKLEEEIGQKVTSLLDSAFTESRKQQGDMFTLDGVNYKLFKISDGRVVCISKHSPKENSRPKLVIDLLECIITNIQNGTDTSWADLKTKIKSLI